MALSETGIADGDSPISAAHITQFYDLLTGAMTDQPVTLKNRVTIGGNQATGDNTLTLVGVAAQTGLLERILKALGDANPTYGVDASGKVSWGAGGASATDTTLERVGAGNLKTNGFFTLTQQAGPAAPGAGLSIVYFDNSGNPFYRSGAAGAATAMAGTNITDPLVAQVFG